ncbi:MAG: hypothetical protein AAB677_01550 [Patescibacteria group bacterium]
MLQVFKRLFGKSDVCRQRPMSSPSMAVMPLSPPLIGLTTVRLFDTFTETAPPRQYFVLRLEKTKGVRKKYHFFSSKDEQEPVTKLVVAGATAGVEEEMIFPAEIPENLFDPITGQMVKLTVTTKWTYDPTGALAISGNEWRCLATHQLEILTGALAGQQFTGTRYWLE